MNAPATSASFPNGFTSTRTPEDVLRARLPKADAIADQTYFTLLARWPGEIRLFTVEHPLIENEQEALEAVKRNDHAAFVFRNDPDAPRRDVSEDIARAWLTEWIKDGNSPEDDEMPEFVARHISHDEAVRLFSEDYPTLEATI